jgi:hypothetical protein
MLTATRTPPRSVAAARILMFLQTAMCVVVIGMLSTVVLSQDQPAGELYVIIAGNVVIITALLLSARGLLAARRGVRTFAVVFEVVLAANYVVNIVFGADPLGYPAVALAVLALAALLHRDTGAWVRRK